MIMVSIRTICLMVLIFSTILSCGAKKGTPSSPNLSEPSMVKKEKLSIGATLKAKNHLPIEERIALYRQLKKENPTAYNFEDENELNLYGYALLQEHLNIEAIEVFKLNVEQFPNSSNVYDSLGEAYIMSGNKELSVVNYEKSLALNPENFSAIAQIDRIKYPRNTPERFVEKFTKQQYKDDLTELGKTLIMVHPNALKFIAEEDFWNLVEEKQQLITNQTTYPEFNWHCSEIIASINCSHTSMGRFFQECDMLPVALRFPLQTRWVNEQLFVTEPVNNGHAVAIKDEIVSINGKPVSALIKEVYKHISSQGFIETTKKHFFNTWSTGMIPYALGFPESYEIVVKGKEKSITLNKAETFKDQFHDPSIKQCKDRLCFEVLKENKTAIMTIASFNYYWDDLQIFIDFVDASFKEVEEKGIANLIVDLRFNGGGSSESSIHLLKYLSNKPFTYFSNAQGGEYEDVQNPFNNAFEGKCYFIIDGNGNSTTGHFMSIVKDLNLGTIVGEELGSNQLCSGGQRIFRLTNTGLGYYVANNIYETTATSLPDEQGILPDHYVTQSIEDYLNKIDVVKEYTIQLIGK